MCQSKETCQECETTPGCGWCSDENYEKEKRCSSKIENERSCNPSSLQQKFPAGFTILPENANPNGGWLDLSPQRLDLRMNVGDIKYLDFEISRTYVFSGNGTLEITHTFPNNVNVKIFSTCGNLHESVDVTANGCLIRREVIKFIPFLKSDLLKITIFT